MLPIRVRFILQYGGETHVYRVDGAKQGNLCTAGFMYMGKNIVFQSRRFVVYFRLSTVIGVGIGFHVEKVSAVPESSMQSPVHK